MIIDILYLSSYWIFYNSLQGHPVHPHIKNQIQMFGYYTVAFFMTRYCLCLVEEVKACSLLLHIQQPSDV